MLLMLLLQIIMMMMMMMMMILVLLLELCCITLIYTHPSSIPPTAVPHIITMALPTSTARASSTRVDTVFANASSTRVDTVCAHASSMRVDAVLAHAMNALFLCLQVLFLFSDRKEGGPIFFFIFSSHCLFLLLCLSVVLICGTGEAQ